MFSRQDMGIFAWYMFFIISAVPVVNLLFWLILLFSRDTNRSLKNLLLGQLILGIVVVVLVFGLGIGVGVIDMIMEQIPA